MSSLTYEQQLLKSIRTSIKRLSNRDGLKVCHLNARSLTIYKLDVLEYIFADSDVDIICVSETWFKRGNGIPDHELNISKYTIMRNDRTTFTQGGGVAMYIRSDLRYEVVAKSKGLNAEYLIAEVVPYRSRKKCLVACAYVPDKNCTPLALFNKLSELTTSSNRHIIVFGDFNRDLLRNGSGAREMYGFATSNGLTIYNTKCPTRFGGNSQSLLDLLIVRTPSLITCFKQYQFGNNSDHDLLYCCYDV